MWDAVEFSWMEHFLDLPAVQSLALTAKAHPTAETPFTCLIRLIRSRLIRSP